MHGISGAFTGEISLHRSCCFSAVLLLLCAGCAQSQPNVVPTAMVPAPAPQATTRQDAAPPGDVAVSTQAAALPQPSPADVNAEIGRLRAAFAQEVPQRVTRSAIADTDWISFARARLSGAAVRIEHSQLLVVIDRAPRVQELRLIVAQPGSLPWYVIGGSKVSTGQAERHGYFITPVGVFPHTTDILDYRALGTFNENHIRGLGLKGMRVWDFGWQTTQQGWGEHAEAEIRLLLHATDPDYLEQRLGRTASKGCVRIPASMNRFLDTHGVLDADYEQAAVSDLRFAAVLLPGRQPSPLAGTLMVVIDSSMAT